MVDDPKKAFNERGNPNFRDKDNAKPDLKPKFSSRPTPNLAPAGQQNKLISERVGAQPLFMNVPR